MARALSGFNRDQLGSAIEVLIALRDVADVPHVEDEPDFSPRSDGLPGDPSDHEPGGDEEATAYVEWTTLRGSQKGGQCLLASHEDDEDSDVDEDDDPDTGIDDDPARLRSGRGLRP